MGCCLLVIVVFCIYVFVCVCCACICSFACFVYLSSFDVCFWPPVMRFVCLLLPRFLFLCSLAFVFSPSNVHVSLSLTSCPSPPRSPPRAPHSAAPLVQYVVLDSSSIHDLDSSSLKTLEGLVALLVDRAPPIEMFLAPVSDPLMLQVRPP